MHPLTCIGILGGVAITMVDRIFHRVPNWLAIAVYLVCLGLMLAGILLKKHAG